MANFSSLQSKFTKIYESNPQYRMLSIDFALAQMVKDGVLTKAEYDQLIKTSAFGFGFNSDFGDSVNFGGTTPVENYQHSPSGGIVTSNDKPKFGQLGNGYIDTATLPVNYQIIPGEYTILSGESYTAFSYLSDIFNKAETSFEQQRMNEGWVSDAINTMRGNINETDIVRLLEYFSLVKTKATREEVNEKLADTRNDIELLNAAMRGALVDGNGNNVDFETAFEATRGVKYSKEKIELCQQKAETYAQADMLHSGLEELISNLEKYSYGTADLQYAKEFNKNALKTLSILGLSDQGKINEALAETSKAVGYEIKLVKQGTKGKDYYGQDYAIMFKNKDGKFVPLTPEISRIISDDLISKIDVTKKALLGLPLDSSDKEVEKHLEQLKNDYEQSFKEAYGDKDISILSEEYIAAQQKGLMTVNLVANVALIATSMFTGGATAGLMTGLLMTQPLQALEMFTDENAETNLEAYGKMMLSQLPWMGAGMVMGKLGDLARSFVKLKGLQKLAANSGRSLDDLINIATNASKTGHKLPADLQKAMKITRRIADASGMSVEMALDYAVTKFAYPEGATSQDWIMSFVGALAGSSLNKNISDFTKTKDVRAVELQKAFPDLKLSAEEAGKIISKIDEMVADGSWEKAAAKGADENAPTKPRMGLEAADAIRAKEKALKEFIDIDLGKFDLGKISLRINEKGEIIIISEEIMKQVSDKIGQLNKDGGNLINYIKNNLDFDYKNSNDLKNLIEAYVEKYVENINKSNNEKAKNGIRETVIKKIESAKKEYENCVNEYEYISLQNFLKEVVDLIPDFSKMIQQAPSWGHLYTLDIHTLKVLQNIFKIINSLELNEKEKTILLYASLFHDIGKVGLDEELMECHPDKSKDIAKRILNDMNIDRGIVDMVCTLIENHEWYGDFNKGKLSMGDIRDIEKKDQQVFKLLKIFAQADIEAIRGLDITSEVGTPLWYYGVSHFDITSSYDLPPIIIRKSIDNINSSSGDYNIEKGFKTVKALSRVDVNTATDSDILSIWARRKYSSFDEEEYMPRLNKLCTHSIRQDKDQLFVRTIPVDFQLPSEGETFSIGKPSLDNNDITYPAAIARVNISDGGELPKAIIDNIIKDKKNYILSYMVKYAKDGHLTPEILQQHPLPASTVFIIENIQNAKGFDFGELGPIIKTEQYNATECLGSRTFQNTVDVDGKSTEVILSSGTKFKQSINQAIEEYEFNIYGIPFQVKVVYITSVE